MELTSRLRYSFLRRRALSVAGVLGLAVAGLSCGERATGPASGGQAAFAFAPGFSERAAFVHSSLTSFGLSIDNVRIQLRRADGSVVIDTVVTFAADQETISVTLKVDIKGNQETFAALVELRQGTTVLFSGTQSVTARAGTGTPSVPEIETEYVGPGATAVAITISPRDSTIPPGATIDYDAVATDAQAQPVLDIPREWVLSDSSVGTVDASGLFTATAVRGTTLVIARLPTRIADTVQVTIVPPATHLAVVSGQNQTGPVGAALPAPIVIESRAADNLPVPGVAVTFALTLGGGELSVENAVTDALGRAGTTLTFDQTPGARTVTVTSDGLPALTIGATATPAAPTHLVITQEPSASAAVGVPLGTPPIVALRDQFNNPVMTSGVSVIATLTSPAMGMLGGPVVVNTDAAGQAVFLDLTVNGPVGNASITFTSGALTPAVSSVFTVTLGPPTTLLVEGGTQVGVVAGQPVPEDHALRVVDAGGNGIADVSILVEQAGNPDVTLITGADGRVHLSELDIPTVIGTYILTFSSGTLIGSPAVITVEVLSADASQLSIVQQPSSIAASNLPLAQQPHVQILDNLGNPAAIEGVDVTAEVLGGSHTLGGTITVTTEETGLAIFTDLSIIGPDGPVQVQFTAPGMLGVTSEVISLIAAAPTHLVFTTQPANGGAGVPFTVAVAARDAQNNTVTSFTSLIHITLGNNPSDADLSGTVTVTPVAGVATFTGISVDKVGEGYTLVAAAEGLVDGTSNAFNMVAGAGSPTQLAFTTQPANVLQGASFGVAVTARDPFGDPATGFTGPVTIAIANNPAGGVLGGVATVNAVAGVATFTGLSISEDGEGYTLTATSGALTPATSNAFDVTFSGVTHHDVRRPGDIAIYKNYNAWKAPSPENKDEVVLQGAPFRFAPGLGDYVVRPMSLLATGIPAQTSLIIITSASQGNLDGQITQQNAGAPNLDAWVRNGGWLVVHAGDNALGQSYIIPGASGLVDDVTSCTGIQLMVADHAVVRGPDAALGTEDDLTPAGLEMPGKPSTCDDNHGALEGILPANAEVLMRETGDDQRAIYATYTLGAGRVIVTTITLEHGPQPIQTLINHFYWAIYGVDAPPAEPVVRTARWLGGDGNWNDPSKWDIGLVPTSEDIVRIEAPGTYTVTLGDHATVASLTLGGGSGIQTLATSAWTLTLTSPSVVAPSGRFFLNGGGLAGAGDLVVNGELHVANGNLSGSGTTRIATGGTGTITAVMGLNGGRRLEIAGTAVFEDGGLTTPTITFANGSTLAIEAGGEFEVRGGVTAVFNQNTGGGSIINAGRFARTTAGDSLHVSVPFTNNGQFEVSVGTVVLSATGTFVHSGTFVATPTTTLRIQGGGNHTFNGAFTGGGNISFTAGTQLLAAPASVGAFIVNSGTVTANGTLTVADSLRILNGTLNLNTGDPVAAAMLIQTGGTLQGADTVVVADSLHWTAGTMTGTGATRLLSTATGFITGAVGKTLTGGRGFELLGTLRHFGGTFSVGAGSVISIEPDAEYDMQHDVILTLATAGSMTNAGRIVKSGGPGTAQISLAFTNAGVIQSSSGTLALFPAASAQHSGTFIVDAGAVLQLSGSATQTFDSTITGAGLVRASGTTQIMNGTVAISGFVTAVGATVANGPFEISDSLVITGGSVGINTATPVSLPRLRMAGGQLGGSATVTVTDSLVWSVGTMTDVGQTRIAPTAHVLFGPGAKPLTGGRTFSLFGTAQFTDAASVTFGGGSSFIVESGADVEIIENNVLFSPTTGSGTLINHGSIRRTSSTGLVTVAVPFENSGTVEVHSGTLRFQNTGAVNTHGGDFEVAAPAIIDYGTGPFTLTSTITGTGTVLFSGATVTAAGTLAPGTLRQTGGTLTLESGGQVEVPVVAMFTGTLQGADTLVALDSLEWGGGTMTGTGLTRVAASAVAYFTTGSTKNLIGGRGFLLEGSGFVTGSSLTLGGGSPFTIESDGALSFLGDFGFSTTTGGGTVMNRGILAKSAGTGVSTISSGFVNEGSVAVMSGTLRISSPAGAYPHTGEFAAVSPAILDIASPGTHSFTGSIAGTGAMSFTGNGTSTVGASFALPSLSVSNGVVDFSGTGQVEIPRIQLTAGTLQGTDTLIVTDSMTWTTGTQTGAGTTRIDETAKLALTTTGGRSLLGGRRLEAAGSIVAVAGSLAFGGGSALLVEGTGEIDFQGVVSFGVTTGSGTFTNLGLVKRTAATGTATITVPFTNDGLVDVGIGVFLMQPTGTFTHAGDFTVNAPGAITFTTATHVVNGTVTGTGVATVGTGTTTFNNAINLRTFSSTSGTTTFNAAAFAVDTLRGTGGSVDFNTGTRHQVPVALMNGWQLTGVDTIAVTDSLDWTSGAMGGTGRTELLATASAVLSSVSTKTLNGGRSLDIAGTLLWTGGTWQLANGSPIRVAPTGEFTVTAAASMNGTGSLLNEGTLRRTTTTGNASFGVAFTNTGDVNVATGGFVFTVPAGSVTHTGPFVVNAPASLEFAGVGTQVVDTSITGTGTARFAGTSMTVNGSLGVPIVVTLAGTTTVNGPISPLDSLRHIGGTLSFNGGTTIPVTRLFLNTNGALQGSDTLIVLDSMEWAQGAMGGLGATRIVDTAQLVISGSGGKSLVGGRSLEIAGNARWTAGTITLIDPSPLTLAPTGILDITGNVTLAGAAGSGPFENHGLVRRTTATGIAVISAPFENHGLVQVVAGTLTVAPPDTRTHTGPFEVTSPAALNFQGITHVIDSTITGSGRLVFGANSTTVNGSIAVASLSNNGGTSILGPLAALDTLSLTGTGTLLLDRGAQVQTSVLLHIGGTLGGIDTLVVTDSLLWNAGTMNGSGRTELAGGGRFFFGTGGKGIADTRVLKLGGSGAWTGGTLSVTAGSALEIAPAAELDIRFNASMAGAGTLRNEGRLVKSISTGAATLAPTFVNDGEVEVTLGSLAFSAASGASVHGGTFLVNAGTSLTFSGAAAHQMNSTMGGAGAVTFSGSAVTLNGAFTVPHVLYSAGSLTVNGPFTVADSLRLTATNPLTVNTALNVPSGSLFSFRGTGGVAGTGTVTNLGNFQKLTGTGTATVAVPFNNQGTLSPATGTFNFTRSFAHQPGALIQGGATVTVIGDSVTAFGGDISPTGTTLSTATLTINGGVVQQASSTLNIEIGGLTQTSQYDRLAVSAMTAPFIGTLNVTVINGFTPVNGNTVRVLTWGSGPAPTFLTTNLPPNWTLVPGATFLDLLYNVP